MYLKGYLLYFIQHFQVFLAGAFPIISFVSITENGTTFLFNVFSRDK